MQTSLSRKTTQEKVFTNANLIQIPIEYLVYTNIYLCGNLEFTKYIFSQVKAPYNYLG